MADSLPFDHVDRPENHRFVPVRAQTGCARCGYARGHHPTAAMLRIAVAASLFKPGGTMKADNYGKYHEQRALCTSCHGKRWLIVDINSTGTLAIERCDLCSGNLTDDQVRALPEAQAALRQAQGGAMKFGKPCPRELATHIEQLRAKLRAEYGADYSFSIMGRGYLLAGSNCKDGEIEAIPTEAVCLSESTRR